MSVCKSVSLGVMFSQLPDNSDRKVRHINSDNGSQVNVFVMTNRITKVSVKWFLFVEEKELYKLGRLIESFGELVSKFRLWGCGNSRKPCAICFDFSVGNLSVWP